MDPDAPISDLYATVSLVGIAPTPDALEEQTKATVLHKK